jgi:hypothetical protein
MFGKIVENSLRTALLAALSAISTLVSPTGVAGQSATVTDDAFLSSNATTQSVNLNGQGGFLVIAGSNATVGSAHVGATTAYIKFQLPASLPPTVTAANVTKATLKLYLSLGTNPSGTINIYPVASAWTESALSASSPPALSSMPFVTGLAVGSSDSYLVVDVTKLVQDWLNGSSNGGFANDGIALVAGTSSSYVVFDSKEGIVTSHEPRLEIVLANDGPQGPPGPQGPIGPAGQGSVIAVNSGPGIIGGPITATGTLSLDTSLTNSLYARLGAPNTFNGDQAINGNFGAISTTNTGGGVSFTSQTNLFPYAGNGSPAFSVEAYSNGFARNLISQLSVLYNLGGGTGVQITNNTAVGQALEIDCTLAGSDCEGIIANGTNYGGIFSGEGGEAALGGLAGAGSFNGDVNITGTLTKGAGAFKIDHPLDPANKYLTHSFVESPDMMNIYNGTVVLESNGEAWINLPDWFEALNRDFRYQLTAIGVPAPNLYVAEEVAENRFKIAGGQPGGKVSWQVTGIRHDAYADAHRLAVEEDKPEEDRGYYLHPEVHGQPAEKSIFLKKIPSKKHRAEAPAKASTSK